MKKPLVAGNWKLNKNPSETQEFMSQFLEYVGKKYESCFAIFPPAVNAIVVADALKDHNTRWGGQNYYLKNEGAYTGENSAQVFKELGADMGLVGHSERRQIFKEDDDLIAEKVLNLQNLGLTPILCVGETIEQREADQTQEVVFYQLIKGLSKALVDQDFVIAYEPVWAIGTGKVATPEVAEEVHAMLRQELSQLTSPERAAKVPLLYGGSVKPSNSKVLFAQQNIDGFLVGGASLDARSFVDIFENCLS